MSAKFHRGGGGAIDPLDCRLELSCFGQARAELKPTRCDVAYNEIEFSQTFHINLYFLMIDYNHDTCISVLDIHVTK